MKKTFPRLDDPYVCFLLALCSYYCESGTHSPTPCPAGTYNPWTNQGSVTGCFDCIAGQACTQEALTQPDSSCAPGHYCPTGTVLPTDTDCPAGTYTNFNNLTISSQCETCPPTVACPAGTGGVNLPPVACAQVSEGFGLWGRGRGGDGRCWSAAPCGVRPGK